MQESGGGQRRDMAGERGDFGVVSMLDTGVGKGTSLSGGQLRSATLCTC